jgi:hypothetical protein
LLYHILILGVVEQLLRKPSLNCPDVVDLPIQIRLLRVNDRRKLVVSILGEVEDLSKILDLHVELSFNWGEE